MSPVINNVINGDKKQTCITKNVCNCSRILKSLIFESTTSIG